MNHGVAAEVTIVVVSLGEDPRLPACLAAASEATSEATSIILVQNGTSGIGPPLLSTESKGRLRRLRRPENPGFAQAWNDGAAQVETPFLISLNPDCVLHADSIRVALSILRDDPSVAAVALRLLRPDADQLDSAGISLGFLRRAKDRGAGGPARGRFETAADVDAACLAGAVLRVSALKGVEEVPGEILDSRFFAYKEDVDLGWRLRRAGWRIRYEPRATAVHERGWKPGERAQIPPFLRRFSLRNRWLMIAKNESAGTFFLRLFPYLLWEVSVLLYVLFRERDLWPAYGEAARLLPGSFRRRTLPQGR